MTIKVAVGMIGLALTSGAVIGAMIASPPVGNSSATGDWAATPIGAAPPGSGNWLEAQGSGVLQGNVIVNSTVCQVVVYHGSVTGTQCAWAFGESNVNGGGPGAGDGNAGDGDVVAHDGAAAADDGGSVTTTTTTTTNTHSNTTTVNESHNTENSHNTQNTNVNHSNTTTNENSHNTQTTNVNNTSSTTHSEDQSCESGDSTVNVQVCNLKVADDVIVNDVVDVNGNDVAIAGGDATASGDDTVEGDSTGSSESSDSTILVAPDDL